ncbi:MAG: hypothetical protein LIO41_05355 [Ruminococcus sp.]|nr:hypothetical protein [Ruminococcus sp.]
MLYTDLIFIYAFLPITTLLTMCDRSTEYKNLILVLSSVVFFAWGKPFYICVIFLSVLLDWLFGLIAGSEKGIFKVLGVLLSAVMNISIFVVVGYNFLFTGTSLSLEHTVVPVGMGFYAVRGLSYVFDVAYGRIKSEKNLFCLVVYMVNYTLFLAGPVVRYKDIREQIRHRIITGKKINDGLTRFIVGLGKASIIAAALGYVKNVGLDLSDMTFCGALFGMIAYIMQICFLFSGYADMAIGLGLLNGFEYDENFLPLKAKNGVTGAVSGFNHTLMRFVNDSLISPLSKSPLSAVAATLGCSVLVGLWYGFSKHYLVFGLYFGIFVIIEALGLKKLIAKLPTVISGIYTLVVIFFGWSTVYFTSVASYKTWVKALLFKNGIISDAFVNEIYAYCALLVFAVFMITPFKDKLKGKIQSVAAESERAYAVVRILTTVGLLVILLMSTTSRVVY